MTEQLGGASYPGIGFAMGLERIMLLLNENRVVRPVPQLYIAAIGERAKAQAALLAQRLIAGGVCVEYDIMDRSLKAQMKYADKVGAKTCVVIGDNELDTGRAVLKSMSDDKTLETALENINLQMITEFLDR